MPVKLFLVVCSFFFAPGLWAQGDCNPDKDSRTYSYSKLSCFKEFDYLQGVPLSAKYGQVKSVKIVYGLYSKKLYYINSKLFRFHYEFCRSALDYEKDLEYFNYEQYGDNPNRVFLLANLNYYSSSGKYVLEFFPGDKISIDRILVFFSAVSSSSYFSNRLFLMVNSEEMMGLAASLKGKVPLIYPEEIYGQQKYQPLTLEETYGYVKRVKASEVEKQKIGAHDILVLDAAPNDIPLVAGILTSEFQTPLSHLNVLCHNRRTPNAAYKGIGQSRLIDSLDGKLVHYVVKNDVFFMTLAEAKEAEKFWSRKSPKKELLLKKNLQVNELLEIQKLSARSVSIAGGKAANLGELYRIKVDGKRLPVPEGAFAIPFYFYDQHISRNGIKPFIDRLIYSDSIKNDPVLLEQKLKEIRALIKKAPLDSALLAVVKERIRKNGVYKTMRFRSSTNAEDVENFNGAGLYDSKTGILDDTVKTIEKAILQVWASLWNLRAFQEREYFRIDHATVAMGILVHRAFGEEAANGVAVTRNLYRQGFPGFTVNVQKGEVSVVFPPDSVTCDQFIAARVDIGTLDKPNIDYLTRSNLNGHHSVMTEEEVAQLVKYLHEIKNHYFERAPYYKRYSYEDFGVDVEFKLDKTTRKIYIKQARPY